MKYTIPLSEDKIRSQSNKMLFGGGVVEKGIPPTATNQSALNTGYTTGSAIYFKTENSSSKARNKNLGPVFIESTIDDGFDNYEYIEK